MTSDQRPFTGTRVIDMTHVLAGPFSTYQLAVLGADVIKVEGPNDPDMTRIEGATQSLNDELYGTYFLGQNGAKRGLAVDIRTPEGRDILKRLVATADVLVENYRNGKMDALGLGYEDLTSINPKLIYCSLTGFGHSGPRENDPAYDIVIQAFAGLMVSNGEKDAPPVRVGAPMVDYGTGAQAAFAIASALFQRERSGRGQRIDVSMADSALMLQSMMVSASLTTGEPPVSHGNPHPKYAGYATYQTADGLVMIGAWTNRQMGDLYRLLGDEARAGRVETTARKDVKTLLADDTAFLEREMLKRSAQEWETFLNAGGVPASRVRDLVETLESEQIAARPVLQTYAGNDRPDAPNALPVAGFAYEHDGPELSSPPPRLGEHTAEILEELGCSADEIADLRRRDIVL